MTESIISNPEPIANITPLVTLRAMIAILNSLCDGAQAKDKKGFNKVDAKAGRKLYTKIMLDKKWICGEVQQACNLAVKYSGQLPQYGYNASKVVEAVRMEVGQVSDLIGLVGPLSTFRSPDGVGYVQIQTAMRQDVVPLTSLAFERWISQQYYEVFGVVPKKGDIDDAVRAMIGAAVNDGQERSVFTRVGEHEGRICIDLCNDRGQCVEVTKDGWSVLDESPVAFVRSDHMKSLPVPEKGGQIDQLRPFLNIESEGHFRLIVAWMAYSLQAAGPFPILTLRGEQGCGKSTMAQVIRSLVDPSSAPLVSPPKNEEGLVITAKHSWVVAFDNLSRISDMFSDQLCRLATGGSFQARKLYTDSELLTISIRRPCILNGIDEVVGREDLRNRCIVVDVPMLHDANRRTGSEFWHEFDKVRPALFCCLLDGLSTALRNRANVHLASKPRMADFVVAATAVESAFGWEPGSLLQAL